MPRSWQLQEAKNKFSEVVKAAQTSGPQLITRHGAETAIVLSCEDYRKLLAPPKSLSRLFGESPLAGVGLDLARDSSPARKVPTL